jgi:hypothetical protein
VGKILFYFLTICSLWPLFVTSAHSREAGISKDRQLGIPGIGGEPGGPVYRESVVKRLIFFSEMNY